MLGNFPLYFYFTKCNSTVVTLYVSPTPFSDPETKALSEFMTAHIDEIKVFITFHSYGQYILTPFAYTLDPAENDEQLKQVGNAGADAIRQRYGTNYVVGSSSEVLCKFV